MQPPLLPADETKRLESLRRMQLLYTPDEGALDSVTRTAKLIFQTPHRLDLPGRSQPPMVQELSRLAAA